MKNKRELIIAVVSLLIGVIVFFMQSHSGNKQIVQYPKLQAEQSTPKSNVLDSSLKTAIELVKKKGYTVFDSSTYQPSESLNSLVGMCTGSADGHCHQAFFFYRGVYIGTDTSNPSIDVGIKWSTGDTIALEYTLYHRDDPLCCSTVGAAIVRFQWDGTKLKALDPIPTSDWSADIHR